MKSIITYLKKSFIDISNIIRFQNALELGNEENNENLKNVSGDFVKKLDMMSHHCIVEAVKNCEDIRGYISEESENVVYFKGRENASYLISFDPLDGSSNIDANITMGTIFCIFKYNKEDLILSGDNIVCSGYCLYSGSTQLIIAQDNEVKLFLLDQQDNFKYIKSLSITFKKIYSINESNNLKWKNNQVNELIDYFKEQNYTNRWVGSMVADCHRTLIKGGCFMYPGIKKKENGKLRLLYEAMPFAFIFKLAGGESFDGEKSILERKVDLNNIHEYCEVFLGDTTNLSVINYYLND